MFNARTAYLILRKNYKPIGWQYIALVYRHRTNAFMENYALITGSIHCCSQIHPECYVEFENGSCKEYVRSVPTISEECVFSKNDYNTNYV